MTSAEIKKAFEQFKKEIKKEAGLEYGFTMNKKQIEKRTATYTVESSRTTYDENIAVAKMWDERVQSYDSWTDEEKARSHADAMERIEHIKARKEKYGTKANEVKTKAEIIKNSKAFKKFEDTVNKTTLTIEIDSEGFYKIRFNY